jgi:UDP-GlcNAc3NAcA epimerase
MKILTIVGARPQFVKAAVVSRAISQSSGIEEVIVHTGQHYDASMSSVFFEEMCIPHPKYHLAVGGLSHGAMTGRMIEKIEEVLISEKPDWTLVYGDTNSTLAGALAASKLHVPVAHVEAGLRSYNMEMPEEINRILTDRISNILFTPTTNATENLKKEGFSNFNCRISQVGDVMYDAALFYSKDPKAQAKQYGHGHALVTIHRASNTDNPEILKSLVETLNTIAEGINVICPLHPRTQKCIDELGIKTKFKVIAPVGYFQMIDLLQTCSAVLTDSGGLQKEAYFFGKPCLTLREETEWSELAELGCNFIVGVNQNKILTTYKKIKETDFDFSQKPYGNGDAGDKIVQELLRKS